MAELEPYADPQHPFAFGDDDRLGGLAWRWDRELLRLQCFSAACFFYRSDLQGEMAAHCACVKRARARRAELRKERKHNGIRVAPDVEMATERPPVAGGPAAADDEDMPELISASVVGGPAAAGDTSQGVVRGPAAAGNKPSPTGPTLLDALKATTGGAVPSPGSVEPSPIIGEDDEEERLMTQSEIEQEEQDAEEGHWDHVDPSALEGST